MFVYFRETDEERKIQNTARIQAKKRVQRIRAVEIFSELLDEADETDAVKISKTESLFLITSEDESSIVDIEIVIPTRTKIGRFNYMTHRAVIFNSAHL